MENPVLQGVQFNMPETFYFQNTQNLFTAFYYYGILVCAE